MKISKNQLIDAISAIVILVLSLTILLLQCTIPFNFFTHPILNFLLIIAFGFAVLYLVKAIIQKHPLFFLICAILLTYCSIYVLCQFIIWWTAIIFAIVLDIIISILSIIFCGNKTEEISKNK